MPGVEGIVRFEERHEQAGRPVNQLADSHFWISNSAVSQFLIIIADSNSASNFLAYI